MATRKSTTPVKKTAVESPRKKTVVQKKEVKSEVATSSVHASTQESKKSRIPAFKIKRSYVLIALGLVILLGAVYLLRNFFIVASVNGQPITRLEYNKELERLSGKQALNSLVTKTLITQEAKKQKVTVSNDETAAEIKEIETNLEKQGQKLDSVLALQGLTREALQEQVYLQKLIEKMVGKDIKVEDKEIDDYIAQNQESLPQEGDPKELRTQVSEQLKQQKLNDAVQSWLQQLQQNAKVTYSTPQTPEVPVTPQQ